MNMFARRPAPTLFALACVAVAVVFGGCSEDSGGDTAMADDAADSGLADTSSGIDTTEQDANAPPDAVAAPDATPTDGAVADATTDAAGDSDGPADGQTDGVLKDGLSVDTSSDDADAPETAVGDASAIDTTASDVTTSDTTTSDTTTSDTTASDTTAGDTTASDTAAGDTAAGDVAAHGDSVDDTHGDAASAVDATAPADVGPSPDATTKPPSPGSWTGSFSDMSKVVPSASWPVPAPVNKDQEGQPPNYPWLSGGLIADLTGDGIAELLTFTQDGKARIHENLAKSKFAGLSGAATWTNVAAHASHDGRIFGAAVIDLKGDGGRELLLSSARLTAWRKTTTGWVDVTASMGLGAMKGDYVPTLNVVDIDNDGMLDIVAATGRCLPAHAPAVWRNRGDGKLELRPELSFAAIGAQWSSIVHDLDGDGDQDVVLLHDGCGDKTSTQFFARNMGRDNEGWPQFKRQAPHLFFNYPVSAVTHASPMGGVLDDFDGDLLADMVLANVGVPMPPQAMEKFFVIQPEHIARLHQHVLFLSKGASGSWIDKGKAAGLKALRDPVKNHDLVGWAVWTVDLDRDGQRDIGISHGEDEDAVSTGNRGPQRPTLLRNDNGVFVEVSAKAKVPAPYSSLISAVGDLDGDGDDDLVLGGLGKPVKLLRNDIQHGNHFLRVRLRRTTSNSMGIGAVVTAQTPAGKQRRFVGGSGSFGAPSQPIADFGLGSAKSAQVTVRWPSGYVQQLGDVAADQTLLVKEPPLVAVSKRVASLGTTVTVTIRPHDPQAKPTKDAVKLSIVPSSNATYAKPLSCAPDGTCTAKIAHKAGAKAGTSVALKVSIGGNALQTWPRITWLQP